MQGHRIPGRNRCKGVVALAAVLATTPVSAHAFVCRVTDFTDRTLASLSEVQRLSLVTEMTQTEYNLLKSAKPGSANHYRLIAESANIREARAAARTRLYTLDVKNVDGYRRTWASDFLTDEQTRKFLDCMSARQPGLMVAGQRASVTQFNMSFTHLTPIGIRKITTDLVGTYNIANADALSAFLKQLGPQDNYPARTFPLRIANPKERAIVILQAGWETPRFLYIEPHGQEHRFPER